MRFILCVVSCAFCFPGAFSQPWARTLDGEEERSVLNDEETEKTIIVEDVKEEQKVLKDEETEKTIAVDDDKEEQKVLDDEETKKTIGNEEQKVINAVETEQSIVVADGEEEQKVLNDEEIMKTTTVEQNIIKKGTDMANVLSKLELSLIRCCSSRKDRISEVARCFEVNGFGGINFSPSLCSFLTDAAEKLGNIEVQ